MKIKHNCFGIFGKVFLYTMLILLLVIGGMFLFFSSQIKSTVTETQQQQTKEVFAPLLEQLRGKTNDEIAAFAEEFQKRNASFIFRFTTEDGKVLFQTDDFVMQDDTSSFPNRAIRFSENALNDENYFVSLKNSAEDRIVFFTRSENGVRLYVASTFSGTSVYMEILEKAAWIFGIVFLVSLIAALLFARRIAKPIQKVSADTHAMSLLLPVDPSEERGDEIGQLSKDVYAMYDRLKSTIHQLETENKHVKQMEENQRYFFSAASHELKTPIAAAGAIFEGMLNDVITQEEYPAYLREGMKLIGEQNKLVSEILELVKLGGETPVQNKETIRLRECVDGVLDSLLLLIQSKEQRLAVDAADGLTCELNKGLFLKALSNILLNAAQNSPDGSEIRVAAREENGCVQLIVWNGGVQIPEETLPKLCEPFYRADDARSSGEGRSGLGLAIVKKTLDLMEVIFSIKNIDGGVLFQMDIPNK